MKRIKVKPRQLSQAEQDQYPDLVHALVRKPAQEGGALLKSEGELVPETIHWLRRIKAGDVVRVGQVKAVAPVVEDQPKTSKKRLGTKE